jgi:hypothetical protein
VFVSFGSIQFVNIFVVRCFGCLAIRTKAVDIDLESTNIRTNREIHCEVEADEAYAEESVEDGHDDCCHTESCPNNPDGKKYCEDCFSSLKYCYTEDCVNRTDRVNGYCTSCNISYMRSRVDDGYVQCYNEICHNNTRGQKYCKSCFMSLSYCNNQDCGNRSDRSSGYCSHCTTYHIRNKLNR